MPLHASLGVDESFVPGDAKKQEIDKAINPLHQGETGKAMQALNLVKIDVVLAIELFPLKWAESHIDKAAKPISEGKFYESKLPLKQVEDSLVIETFAIDDIQRLNNGS